MQNDNGRGRNFIDENKNGVCDRFENAKTSGRGPILQMLTRMAFVITGKMAKNKTAKAMVTNTGMARKTVNAADGDHAAEKVGKTGSLNLYWSFR